MAIIREGWLKRSQQGALARVVLTDNKIDAIGEFDFALNRRMTESPIRGRYSASYKIPQARTCAFATHCFLRQVVPYLARM